MNKSPHPDRQLLRNMPRPVPPELDTRAIMDAVRLEAVRKPLVPVVRGPVSAVPFWACATAAGLAILLTAGAFQVSVRQADRTLVEAWMQEMEPDQLEEAVQTVYSLSPEGGNEI